MKPLVKITSHLGIRGFSNLAKARDLTVVRKNRKTLSKEDALQIARNMHKCHALSLDNCNVRDYIDILAPAIAESRALRHLSICDKSLTSQNVKVICESAEKNGLLTYFSTSNLGSEHTESFVELIKNNPHLNYLDLFQEFKQEDLEEILKILGKNSSITRANFSYNDGFPSYDSLDFIRDIAEVNYSLTNLYIAGSSERNVIEISNFTQRNRNINDAVEDFAKTILAPRLFLSAKSKTISLECSEGRVVYRSDIEGLQDIIITELGNITRRELLKGLNLKQVEVFSDFWHSPSCQNITAKLRSYPDTKWPSLFFQKEVEIPQEIIGKKGWKIIELTTPEELKEEGKKLEHCVGNYAGECLYGNFHVLSVVDENGQSVSTAGFRADSYQKTVILDQHLGFKNSTPNQAALAAISWFQSQITNGNIQIDYANLAEKKQNQEKKQITTERYLGFDPFNHKEYTKIVSAFKRSMLAPQLPELQKNFQNLLNISQIDLSEVKVNGNFTIELQPFKEALPKLTETQSQESVLLAIQTHLEQIFGKDQCQAYIKDINLESRLAQVVIESESPQILEKIFEVLKQSPDLKKVIHKENDEESQKDKLVVNIRLKFLREILNKIASEQKPKTTVAINDAASKLKQTFLDIFK